MKKIIPLTIVTISSAVITACTINGSTNSSTDSSEVSSATDSMPVLNPGNFDSSGTIKTPPVNDNNVIVPDTLHSLNNESKMIDTDSLKM